MALIIPLIAEGESTALIDIGSETLHFRTYFVSGADNHWLLDIADAQERPLIKGLNLVPGIDNLLKGRGDVLQDYQAYVTRIGPKTPETPHNAEKMPEAPGNTFSLLWLLPGESHPDALTDPLEAIHASDFHTTLDSLLPS